MVQRVGHASCCRRRHRHCHGRRRRGPTDGSRSRQRRVMSTNQHVSINHVGQLSVPEDWRRTPRDAGIRCQLETTSRKTLTFQIVEVRIFLRAVSREHWRSTADAATLKAIMPSRETERMPINSWSADG